MNIQNPASNFIAQGNTRVLINGRWVDALGGETFETFNPATGAVLARVAKCGSRDVDAAVNSARSAFEGSWRKSKPYDRQLLLLRLAELVDQHFDELSMLDTLEMGAPVARVPWIKRRALSLLHYYAGMATQLGGETIENSAPGDIFSFTLREPVGVVGAIIPWNSPLTSTIWKIAPAIATGCTLVFKPAEEASLTTLRIAELAMEAGFPDGVLNVVTGLGDVGAAMVEHPGVDKIAFTGSTETGQRIIRASAGSVKRLSLELGGKSPDIVLADADLDAAVAGASMAVFSNTGQICSAGSRLFVERKIYDEFVGRVAEFAKNLKVGNGLDPSVQIGPLVSEKQLERVTGYMSKGSSEGAGLVTGGHRLTEGDLAPGYFVPPTVFKDVEDTMTIAKEEIFGPVVSAIPFDDLDEVVRRANSTPFGLGSGVWTRDLGKAHRLARAVRAGSVWVNCYQVMEPNVPFGGYKMSGYGRESGREHLEEYLETKAVWINMA